MNDELRIYILSSIVLIGIIIGLLTAILEKQEMNDELRIYILSSIVLIAIIIGLLAAILEKLS